MKQVRVEVSMEVYVKRDIQQYRVKLEDIRHFVKVFVVFMSSCSFMGSCYTFTTKCLTFYYNTVRNTHHIERMKVNSTCLKEHLQFCYSTIQPEAQLKHNHRGGNVVL